MHPPIRITSNKAAVIRANHRSINGAIWGQFLVLLFLGIVLVTINAPAAYAQTSGVRVSPARVAIDAQAGKEIIELISVTNSTQNVMRFEFELIALTGSKDPDNLVDLNFKNSDLQDELSGVSWVSVPRKMQTIDPGEKFELPVKVRVPEHIIGGDRAVGVLISWSMFGSEPDKSDSADTSEGANVSGRGSVIAQLILQTPGVAEANAKILALKYPRYVWHKTPRFTARVENSGDTALILDGQVRIKSFGRTVADLRTKKQMALPEGARDLEFVWNNPPLVGRFTPQLIVVGGEGSKLRIVRDLQPIWVLPSWWLSVLIIGAVALPIWARRRYKREQTPQVVKLNRKKAAAAYEKRRREKNLKKQARKISRGRAKRRKPR